MAFWSTLFSTKKETAPPPALDSLRVQVYRSDCVAMRVLDEQSPGTFAVRPLAHGLVEALVAQRPEGESVLRWDVARAFGKRDDELFALGAAQGAATTQVMTSELEFGVEVTISNEFYLSARMLQGFARQDDPYGVLFAPISWHHWCSHVVGNMTMPPVVAMMMMVAKEVQKGMHVAEYEALTGELYWYRRGGRIEVLELVGEGGNVRATSDELHRAMMDALRQPARR